jgi:tetratricopeptide (TPR) repeat protein
MMRIRLAAVLAAAFVPAAWAQEEHHHAHGAADLGTVRFPTSCAAAVEADFTRGVALLHSFGYEESRRAFVEVAGRDPGCAMAQWGIAMTYYHQIWTPPSPDDLAAGKAAAVRALDLGGQTEREKGYIAAIAIFYSHTERLGHQARAIAYRDAMETLSEHFPDDHEAAIFYALAIQAAKASGDASHADDEKSAAILNGLLASEPDHPGIAHYMIHAFDYPELAARALPAARAYAKIAPSSPHALHMPSHIFTRVGLWQESIASNLASADAANRLADLRTPGRTSYDAAHAWDYLEYAYLQVGDLIRARGVLEEATAVRQFDEPVFQAGYSLYAIPGRWTLERRDWKAAAALAKPAATIPTNRFAYAPAALDFARALGAARSGQLAAARSALARIESARDELRRNPIPGAYDWAEQVESMRLAAAAWLARAEGNASGALELARSAADLEDRVGKHAVTPGALLPARELLGDMLLEMDRPAEALAAYEASLRQAPNRFNGLYGAARAAAAAKDEGRARELYGRLVAQCVASSSRPELVEAKRYLAERGER